MPWGLTRYQHTGQSHFVTFCCYHRRPLFTTDASRRVFENALERVRRSFRLRVYGYVVMPEHIHLLLSEPARDTLADALKSLKQGVARRLIGDADHFWQKRYYDFNVHNHAQFVEKLHYIHWNPVKRGLCERPEDWLWRRVAQSSFGFFSITQLRVPHPSWFSKGGHDAACSDGDFDFASATAPVDDSGRQFISRHPSSKHR